MSKKTNLIVGAAATVAATSLLVGCNLYGKEKYKVTFETNGGNPIDPVEVEWGVEYKANVTPTKTGHTFKGWYFDVDLTNPVSEDIIIEGDVSLFAKWEINQYTVSFNTNGGSTVAAVKLDYGATIEVSDPTRVGYEFDGWYTDEELKESFDLEIPNENITVYAKWKENKVNIIFNTNGSGVAGEMKAISYKTEDENLTLPEAIYTRNGYSFKGWSTTPNGEVEFANKASISSLLTKSQDVTLYAVWEAREYDIHFLANGLAYGQDIKVKYDSNIVLPSTNPSKDGHEFVGWGQYKLTADTTFSENKIYYTYDSVSKIYSEVDVVIGEAIASDTYYEAVLFTTESKMPSANLTLNAIWSKNSYTITFNSNGAGEISSITQAYGSVITLPNNLSKEGYRFLGWYKEASLTNRFEGSTMPLDGASLYAKWEANKYSIYFDANSGSGTTNKVDATYDVDATLTTNAFSKVGYTFKGWNTKADGSGTSYTDGQTVKNLLSENGSSLTLYAKWEANTNTKYVVNIFTRNLDGSIEELQSYQEQGTSDTYVNIELLDYQGFVTPENVQVYIKADGSATIDVIYERQSYKVTFTATNPETSEAIASSEIDVKYEGSITFPSSYNVKNYSLVWKYNGEVVNADTKVTGNMTLVAEYTKIEKTIVIHSEGQQNVVISNVDAGSIVVSHLEKPSRTGYTFGGWYLDERFETELSSTVVMPEDNLDIYVKWNINQYTISFDSGVTSITQDYGTVVTAPANPSKTGYIFGGWLRNGQPYSFSTMPAEDVELVAKWEPISYSIVFDGNGGNGTTSSLNKVEYDVTVNLTAVGFSKVGHDFLGWSLDKNATVATYQNTQEVINLSSENGETITLYAVWQIQSYEISFDEAGGSVVTGDKEYDYGTVIELPKTTREGYDFLGWSDGKSLYKDSYTVSTSAVQFVAEWKAKSYTVTFIVNDGTNNQYTQSFEFDKQGALTDFTGSREGYDFLGWSTIKNGEVEYEDGDNYATPAEDVTLYGVWQIQSYEISFDEAGGSVVTGDKEYDYGTVIELPKTTREGYDFLGWSDGKSLYKDSYTVSTSAVQFVAEWKAKSYTVTFIVNDGTNNQYTQSFEFDKQEALTDFTGSREGYTFKGWSTTENGEVKYKDGDNYVTPAEDVTLYGVWQIQSYKLSIDLNGGSLETNPAGNYDYNASISLSTPTKEGHTFLGWYEDNNLYNGTTMPARDVTLKAEWKVNSYKLTLDANGGSGTFEVDFVYGVSTNLPSADGIVKEGYDFLGWSTTPTGTVQYISTAEFTIGAEPVTLYAVWEIKEYTYTFIVGTLDDENVGEDDPNKDIIINITYGESISAPEMESYRDVTSIYKFDGWYLNSSCEGDKAYIAPNNSGTYYGKYIPNPYKIIYQDEEAGNQIFSMDANGENITFMTHVNYLYAKYLGYDHIMASLENAIDVNAKLQVGALTNTSPEYALGMSDYVVNAVYFSCKMNNTNNFNDVNDEYKIQILVGGALGKLGIDENTATAIGLDLQSKAIETLAKLDVFDINDVDKNYVLSILNFANANEEAVRATTDNRKETILTYNNYKEHGFVPSKNGKYFYMWDEQINTETNNVYVAAQWLSKVSTPLNVRVLSTHSSKVTYSWNAVSGVTNYEVYYSINGGAPVTVRVKELAYTIPGLENGDEVEFKVKAINPISEFAPKIEVTGPDGELVVIDEVEVNSNYSKVIEYVHTSSSNADVTAQGEYYYVLDNGTFVFFESKYYSFSNIDHIDIVDINGDKVTESPSAEYLEFTGSDNKLVRQLNILGTGTLNNEFYFKVYRPVANNEVYDSTNEYYQKLTTGSYEVVENPASIDGLYVGVQYRGQINSIVNGLASGEKMNSYLNNTNVENSSLYLNKDFKTYSVGTTSEPQTITVNKDVNGEFIVPLNQGTTEYYYNQLVDETLDTKTYNQYTNGYRFDFEVQANGGITLDGTEFALDYKFFDINGNPIEPSNLYYAYDEENDAFFFKDGVTGKFKVEVAPKLDGFYKTSDKVVVEGKQYYSAPDKTALVTNPSKNGLSTYYEYYQNIDLPKVVKENINLSKYSKEFTFELKDGINVFTQNGLRNAFADTSVSGIIIHSDIKAELHPSQVVYYEYDVPGYSYQKAQYGQIKLDTSYPVEFTTENGYGEKIWSTSKNDSYSIKDKNGTTYYYVGDGGTHSIKDAKFYYDFDKDATTGSFYMLNNYMQQKPNSKFNTASIFTRGWTDSENGKYVSAEDLVIEGNYYTIDGSDLPYITTQFNVGSLFGSTYHIQNVSVSLFETLTYANTTYRNLEIIGNTSNANNTINSEGQTLSIKDYMEMTSGGYIGIRAHEHNTEPSGRSKPEGEGATKVTTENVIVRNCVLGLSVSDYAVAEINDTYITDIWGNGVYGHGGTTYSFNNLKIRNCGGPAVDIEDNYTGMGMKNPIVELSLGQMDIGNYISGEEPWFKAYNMEVIAMGMKSQVDAMLQAAGQPNFTCIKIHTDETTGLTSEKINLVYLSNDKIANNLDTPSIVEGVNTNMTGLQELAPGSGLYCYDPEVALATRLGEEAAKAKAEGNLELAASLQAQALQTLDNSIAKGVLNGNEKYYLKTNKEIAGNRFTIIMELYGHPTM